MSGLGPVPVEPAASGHAALQRDDRRYRDLFDLIPAAYVETDTTGVILDANSAAGALLGEDGDALVGRSIVHLVAHEDRRAFLIQIGLLSAARRPVEFEVRIAARDDRVVAVLVRAAPGRAADGEATTIRWIILDVTETASSRRELEEANQVIRDIIDHVPAGVIGFDADRKVTIVNPAAERLIGRTARSLVGRRLTEAVGGSVARELGDAADRLEAGVGPVPFEVPDPASGRMLGGVAFAGPGGPGLFFEDRTTIKKKEEEARRISDIVAASYDAIIGLDPDGRITSWNAGATSLIGFTTAEAVGRSVESLAVDSERPAVAQWLADAAAVRGAGRLESRWIRRRGGFVDVSATAAPIRDAGGALIGFAAVVRDVTDERRAEEAWRRAFERERASVAHLRAESDIKDSALESLAHDIRMPLTSVLGCALTLERLNLPDAIAADLVRRLTHGARRLRRLVDDLLDLDGLRRGSVVPVIARLDLARLVDSVVEHADVLDHPVECIVEPVVIFADRTKLERIVENLIMNAVHHTPNGTAIRVAVEARADGAEIVVEDRGPGIPDDMKEQIFKRFVRGPRTEMTPGSGIGLALVAELAAAHGGRAWVEDRPGGGASFRVRIPIGHGPDELGGSTDSIP